MMPEATAPLNSLLQKNVQWEWSRQARAAFDLIKRKLTLASYDAKLPVGLASGKGVGACLFHIGGDGNKRVIAYASKSLTPTEKTIPK